VTQYLFRGGSVLDADAGILLEGHEVLVEGDRIKEVSDRPIRASNATEIKLNGNVLMPGLIDAHVHIFITELNPMLLSELPVSYVVASSGRSLRAMLSEISTCCRTRANTSA
jgi:imidazolonepropionase-like amidohydrolase